ncbi:hypothetical protein BGZ61DRAFT_572172 [Ilyonectria robusta]|uniref:uncharacterized protein n=1 Tax=Ilyonectria robusta TaxID=1079257 RepID=UPI001E8DB1DB|nr:uncharacterized protein BGZ61DRAFT_572172 [Ilyonectria robusta]KAH8721950.1 hypothetical protein BGZ61DRAFT_572172 [Ilyonectria robusta]
MAQTMIDCWTFCFVKASSTRFPIFVSSLPIHLDSAFTGGHNRPPMIFASAIKRDPIAEAWPRDSIPQFPPPCLTTESLIQASSDTLCTRRRPAATLEPHDDNDASDSRACPLRSTLNQPRATNLAGYLSHLERRKPFYQFPFPLSASFRLPIRPSIHPPSAHSSAILQPSSAHPPPIHPTPWIRIRAPVVYPPSGPLTSSPPGIQGCIVRQRHEDRRCPDKELRGVHLPAARNPFYPRLNLVPPPASVTVWWTPVEKFTASGFKEPSSKQKVSQVPQLILYYDRHHTVTKTKSMVGSPK